MAEDCSVLENVEILHLFEKFFQGPPVEIFKKKHLGLKIEIFKIFFSKPGSCERKNVRDFFIEYY